MAAQPSSDVEGDDFFFGDNDVERADDTAVLTPVPEQATPAQNAGNSDRGHRSAPRPARERFKTWRGQRPFIPGLLLVLSGAVMLAPAYLTIHVSDLLVMISTISGVSTLLIGAVLIMFGIGMWLQPLAAPYLGVLAILVAIIALPTSNIGGFVVGSLLGIVGGALGLGWEDRDEKPRGKHSRKRKRAQEPATNSGAAMGQNRGGSTKIDLAALRNAKSVAVVLAATGIIAANVGEEPAVSAQEPASLPAQVPAPASLPQLPEPRQIISYPELEPTRTIAPGNLSTVTADYVALTGNVHASIGMINVGDVPTRTLILTGDRLAARNLSLELPGFAARGQMDTGDVETTVTDGPVTVVATALTATPAVAGVPTVPVTVDLEGELGDVLAELGVPDAHPVPNVPVSNFVMDRVALQGVTMQLVSLDGLHLHAPAVNLRVPK